MRVCACMQKLYIYTQAFLDRFLNSLIASTIIYISATIICIWLYGASGNLKPGP